VSLIKVGLSRFLVTTVVNARAKFAQQQPQLRRQRQRQGQQLLPHARLAVAGEDIAVNLMQVTGQMGSLDALIGLKLGSTHIHQTRLLKRKL
tara:strand:+ start:471 stop:746 length:276 start_codon:yes stop_codon:yes gene_type:complete